MAAPKGNQNGVKNKPWTDAIRRAIARRDAGEVVETDRFLNKLAEQLLTDCLNGDKTAREELTNRLDGRFPQPIVGDDDLPPVKVATTIKLVNLAGK
jgi:hypothetical protein